MLASITPPDVERYVTRWLTRKRGVHPHTLAAYQNAADRWIIPTLGPEPIATVKRAAVRAAVESWDLEPGSVRAALPPLAGAFDDAIEDELRLDNPCRGLHQRIFGQLARWTPPIDRAFREPELTRFFRAAPDVCPDLVDYWLLLHRSGIRPGEGLAARWDLVDLELGKLRILQTYSQGDLGPPKWGSARWVDLSVDLVRALEERATRVRGSPWLFPSPRLRGRPYSYTCIRQQFHAICDAADLSDRGFTPHSLRHTFCTWLSEEDGIPIRYLQDAMGHRELSTTEVYMRGARVPNRGYVNALDRRMRRPPLAMVVHRRAARS